MSFVRRATSTTLGKILSFFGVSALAGLLVAGLFLPLAVTGGATASTGSDMIEQFPAELREEPVSVPSRILAEDGTELATFYAENRQPVELDEISQDMQDAIIAIEDERFYEHGGVDPQGIGRALVTNASSGSQQGASTITQQYVNNMLINADMLRGEERLTISGTKTYADKLKEMKLAVSAEQQMSKEDILEGYLNLVLFGGRTYGVEAAAQYYWGIPAAELDIAQAATLAGVVKSPNGYNPETNPEASVGRRNIVLNSMLAQGKITEQEHEEATSAELGLDIHQEATGCISASQAPYFCDYVHREILASEAFGPDVESREQLLNRGGLEITTTLDSGLQDQAQQSVEKTAPAGDASGAGASLVTVEPGTGNIKAMAQNTNYSPEESEDAGNTVLNFNVDAAQGGGNGFQGGSSLKPYVAASWLESGRSMYDMVDASQDHWPQGSEFKASCQEGGSISIPDEGGWKVNNVIDNMKREMTADFGLYWSTNTVMVNMAEELDLCDVTDLTTRLGVHRADDGEALNPANPSFILGAEEFAPMTQAAAYAAFANDGQYCAPRSLVSVTDASGKEYDVGAPECDQALDPEVVAQLNETLTNIAQRTADETGQTETVEQAPMGGKTGTNNAQSSTWYIGYTSGLSTASWVGRYQDLQSLAGVPVNGQRHEDFWGSTLAAPQWFDYMGQTAEQFPAEEFRAAQDSPIQNPGSRDRYQMGGDGTEPGNEPERPGDAADGTPDNPDADSPSGPAPSGTAPAPTPSESGSPSPAPSESGSPNPTASGSGSPAAP
ncbi:transglycosylase domain-containing protein [Citricoccus sp.]|uniref:transglycosylase domain-containing protein n=1 Tax=Citricoccus sp. TaxID=1978372 RepID=UPI0028BED515|nr:transglycosylase domain-containing protein [Citricoccus sp.]